MAIDIVQIADHHASALALLAEQYKGKPILERIIRVFTNHAQQIETVLYEIMLGYRLSTPAVGAQLDVLGRLVGQDRESADDTEYRLRIAARIRANRSGGAAEDLYAVFRILLPDHTLSIVPQYPAAFLMEASQQIDESLLPLYKKFFGDTKAAGVYGQFIYAFFNPSNSFTFDDALAPEGGTGFGDALDAGVGNHLVGVFI